MERIEGKDREILRDLARQQRQLGESQKMRSLEKEWLRHNSCQPGRPMVTVELGTFAQEILQPQMRCQSPKARKIEWELRGYLANPQLFEDDTVVPPYFPVYHWASFIPFGIPVQVEHAGESLGHHFVEVLSDLQEDYHKLGPSKIVCNPQPALEWAGELEELFGDLLPVRLEGRALYAVPTQDVVHLMSMENMLFAMMDYPQLFYEMLERLTDDYLRCFEEMEQAGMLLPTTSSQPLAQGTYCYTRELPSQIPQGKKGLAIDQVWGFLDSQETVGISPQLFEELVFPHYRKIARRYGLLSYGCCEPVHPIWDSCLAQLENLRKVSISPWCDEEKMGERLQGRKTIYQRKPSPNFLGVGTNLEEEALRAHIRKTVEAAKGCTLEFTQRDVSTVGGNPGQVRRYVEIIREECERF